MRIDRKTVPAQPGPGVNFMKPKGFVAAAEITSQMSSPSRSAMRAISLTRPMLTARKAFSRIFVSSAASAEDTGIIRSTKRE